MSDAYEAPSVHPCTPSLNNIASQIIRSYVTLSGLVISISNNYQQIQGGDQLGTMLHSYLQLEENSVFSYVPGMRLDTSFLRYPPIISLLSLPNLRCTEAFGMDTTTFHTQILELWLFAWETFVRDSDVRTLHELQGEHPGCFDHVPIYQLVSPNHLFRCKFTDSSKVSMVGCSWTTIRGRLGFSLLSSGTQPNHHEWDQVFLFQVDLLPTISEVD